MMMERSMTKASMLEFMDVELSIDGCKIMLGLMGVETTVRIDGCRR